MSRKPAAYGFYPSAREECMQIIGEFSSAEPTGADTPRAAVVPHAGWSYSGNIAWKTLQLLTKNKSLKNFIMLGAAHRYFEKKFPIYAKGSWYTPFGDVYVNEHIAKELTEHCADYVCEDTEAHAQEHSIEVVVPLLMQCVKGCQIIPVIVPPKESAIAFGEKLADLLEKNPDTAVIASADLTHYGPNYGMVNRGIGQSAYNWVTQENDKKIIDCMCALDAENTFDRAANHQASCGGGALAAACSALKKCGIKSGTLVEYKTSFDIRPEPIPVNFVGYAGVIF